MPELGPGSRVWIGYNSRCKKPHLCLQKGTVISGPFPHGSFIEHSSLRSGRLRNNLKENVWIVSPDRTGGDLTVVESLLYPLDDNDGEITTTGMESEKCHTKPLSVE